MTNNDGETESRGLEPQLEAVPNMTTLAEHGNVDSTWGLEPTLQCGGNMVTWGQHGNVGPILQRRPNQL